MYFKTRNIYLFLGIFFSIKYLFIRLQLQLYNYLFTTYRYGFAFE